VSDSRDPVAGDRQIGDHRRLAASVVDRAAADDDLLACRHDGYAA
jgi:hypothetical protein